MQGDLHEPMSQLTQDPSTYDSYTAAPEPQRRHHSSKVVAKLHPAHYRAIRRYVFTGDRSRFGGFLTAVFSNDLVQATTRADYDSLDCLLEIATWMATTLPADCWGSAAALDAWELQGGLCGICTPEEVHQRDRII